MKPRDLENLLEKFVLEFAKDEKVFLKRFMRLSHHQLKTIVKYAYTIDDDVLERQENLVDLCNEILGYYFYLYNNKKVLGLKEDQFNLRTEETTLVFSRFLDLMIKLAEVNPIKFLDVLPLCPVFAWDKTLDLAESSFKKGKDSELFTECLTKSKIIINLYTFLFKKYETYDTN